MEVKITSCSLSF